LTPERNLCTQVGKLIVTWCCMTGSSWGHFVEATYICRPREVLQAHMPAGLKYLHHWHWSHWGEHKVSRPHHWGPFLQVHYPRIGSQIRHFPVVLSLVGPFRMNAILSGGPSSYNVRCSITDFSGGSVFILFGV
jgi:hypothetical protein